MGRLILKLLILLLATVNAGYMTYDGYRAFTSGDYLRPAEGEYAGQLGPWTMFASMASIDPLSTTMKSIFLGLGLFGLFSILVFLFRPRLGYGLLLLFCFLTLWNLTFGAIVSFISIILLLSWRKLYNTNSLTRPVQPTKD